MFPCACLDWERRYEIINGIARDLFYPHEASRSCIIHHDLKASNILLNKEINPKISDFAIAGLFATDESVRKTHKIVGTL